MSRDEKIAETLEFFAFSVRSGFKDKRLAFILTPSPNSLNDDTSKTETILKSTIVIDKQGKVNVRDGIMKGATVVRMDKSTFLDVYIGALSPTSAIIRGRISVDGMRYNDVRNFCSSFDFSTQKWNEFYEQRGGLEEQQEQEDDMKRQQYWSTWRDMLIPVSHASSASRSLHLSRRILTENAILRTLETPSSYSISTFGNSASQTIPSNSLFASLQPHFRVWCDSTLPSIARCFAQTSMRPSSLTTPHTRTTSSITDIDTFFSA